MGESRAKKTTRNIASSIIQMILNLIISFCGRMIFVRILDASYLGINGLFTSVLNVLSLADLGMTTAMMFHLYQPIANNDKEKIKNLVAYFRKIYVIIAIAVLCIGLVLIPFLKYIINLNEDIPGIYAYYILALLNVVISYLFVYRTTLVIADQKNYILNKYINIFRIIIFVAQVAVLVVFKNYFLYLLVALIINFFSNCYQNKIAMNLYPFLKENSTELDKKEKDSIFKDIKSLFIYRVAGVLQTNTDSILISVYSGTILVGLYSNYLMILNQIVNVLGLIFNNLKASVGSLMADKTTSKEQSWFMYNAFELCNYWIVAFCSIALFVLCGDFIEICFGEEYVLGNSILLALVLNFYTSNIRQTIWVFRETTGLFEQTRHITVVTTTLNVFGSLIMGYYYGMAGVLYATILARLLYAWWREPQILFNEIFNKSAKVYYSTYLRRVLLTFIIGGITYFVANMFVLENIYIGFMFKVIVCAIIPNLCLILIYYRTDEFKYFYNKIIEMIFHRKY